MDLLLLLGVAMLKKWGVFLSLLILLIGLVPILSNVVGEETSAEFKIDIDQSEQTAKVAPGQKAVVTFTGVVECTKKGVEVGQKDITVNLETAAGGWPWTLSPSTMVFEYEGGRATFATSVRVPSRTSSSISQVIRVFGTFSIEGEEEEYEIEPAYAIINIMQYYKFTVSGPDAFHQFDHDMALDYNLTVQNEGNGQDVIKVKFKEGYEELEADGFLLFWSQESITLAENESADIILNMIAPMKYEGRKDYKLNVTVYSFQALQMGAIPAESTYPIYLRAMGDWDNSTSNDEKEESIASEASISAVVVAVVLSIIVGFLSGLCGAWVFYKLKKRENEQEDEKRLSSNTRNRLR